MSLKAPKNRFKEGTKTLYWVRGKQWEDVDGNVYVLQTKPTALNTVLCEPASASALDGEPLATEAGTQSGCVWACPGCGQDTRETKWICCCSQECLKNWLASREASAEAL